MAALHMICFIMTSHRLSINAQGDAVSNKDVARLRKKVWDQVLLLVASNL